MIFTKVVKRYEQSQRLCARSRGAFQRDSETPTSIRSEKASADIPAPTLNTKIQIQ